MTDKERRKGLFHGLLELLGEDEEELEEPTEQHERTEERSPSEPRDEGEENPTPPPPEPPAPTEPETPAEPRPEPPSPPPTTPEPPGAPTSPRDEREPAEPRTPSSRTDVDPASTSDEEPSTPAEEPSPSPEFLRLTVPDVDDRRAALREILSSGLDERSAGPVADRLLNDPEADVRLAALEGLRTQPALVGSDTIHIALQDPEDTVRAGVVELAATRATEHVSDLAALVGLARWPRTQQTVLDALPGILEAHGLPGEGLEALLGAVAELDPSAIGAERNAFVRIARTLGKDRLEAALASHDAVRLGAVRLLLEEGSEEALRTVARLTEDTVEEIQVAAALARSLLARSAAHGERSRTPATGAAPADRTPPPTPPRTTAQRERHVDPALGGELVGGLARALTDPDASVRERAADTLRRANLTAVRSWIFDNLRSGRFEDAVAAARVVETLGITDAAGGLLERAAGLPVESRGEFVGALSALELDPQTLAGLADGVEASRRHEALRLAWEVAGSRLLPHLTSFLTDSSGPIRMVALEILGESGEPQALEVAHRVLERDTSPAVRSAAVKVLARADTNERLLALSEALDDPDPDVRARAVEVLLAGIPQHQVTQVLLRAAEDRDERVQDAALQHLTALSAEDAPVVWSALRSFGEDQRGRLIGLLEGRAPGHLAELALRHLESPSPDERALAVELASRAGTPECVRHTIQALGDPAPRVRRTAAAALSALRSPEAIPALSRALKDPNVKVRIEAVHALGVIDDDEVIPVLITALKDPEVRVREQTGTVLSRWSSPGVAYRLVEALATPDLARPATELLARMGETAVEPLLEVLLQGDEEVMTRVGGLLADIVGPDPFLNQLASLDPVQRLRATEALGAIGGGRAIDGLIRCLSDPDERIRTGALEHLGRLADERAYDAVRRTFATDPVPEVVEAAERALRALEPTAPQD